MLYINPLKPGYISIHALVKRATDRYKRKRLGGCYFNPRPRKEGDTEIGISKNQMNYFNPRPRKEGDQACR